MQLPELEREKQPRQARGIVLPRKIIIGLLLAFLVLVAGFFVHQRAFYKPVPSVVGMSRDLAAVRLKQAGFTSAVVEQRFSQAKAGDVIEQAPAADKRAALSSEVKLVISGGTEELSMPDVIGDNQIYATSVLRQKGLIPVIIEEPSNKREGTVLSTNPTVGEKVYTGDSVTLRVASQRQQISLRDFDLTGKTIVIVPEYVASASSDPAYDVARRLTALFKAAKATPDIARKVGNKASTLSTAQRTSADVIIWVTLREKGANGIIVAAPEPSAFTQLALKHSIGTAVYSQLSQNTVNVRGEQGSFGPQPKVTRWAKVSLGSLENASDSALMNDATYKDLIAQSIYMGVGLYFAK